MSKKLIISLSIVFSVVAVMLILFWTLFALSSVTVEFHSTTKNLILTKDEIVEAGQFRYGACVFFEGKKASIERINDKVKENENFAYLRVENIETRFPNKFVIHVTEREELFAVEHDGQVLICDRDLRVLRVIDSFVSEQNNSITLKGLKIKNETISIGDFLDVEQESMKKFHAVMLQNNRDLNEQLGKFKEIVLSDYEDEITHKSYVSMQMSTFNGRKFVINNIDFAFANKVQKMFAAESALFTQNTDQNGNILNSKGEVNYVVKSDKGEYISYDSVKELTDADGNLLYEESDKMALTYSILANCYIKVDNLTLTEYLNRTEKDIFYALVEKDI